MTEHFTLSEFTNSATAKKLGINNQLPEELLVNAKRTLEQLEAIRLAYARPITINSGYRCPELNKAVGGVWNSQHLTAEAVDIPWDPELFALIRDNFDYDQLIKENGWIHYSYTTNNRHQVL